MTGDSVVFIEFSIKGIIAGVWCARRPYYTQHGVQHQSLFLEKYNGLRHVGVIVKVFQTK